jgi:hypothetical protein
MKDDTMRSEAPLPDTPGGLHSQTVTSQEIAVVLEYVNAALRGLKFGHVTLVVADGHVVQVDRFEKRRLRKH